MPENLPVLEREREPLRRVLEARLSGDATVELIKAGSAVAAGPGRTTTHVLQVVWGPPSHPTLEVRLRPTRVGGMEVATVVRMAGEGTQLNAALDAWDDAWATLTHMRELDRGSDRHLCAALKDPDPRIQHFAITRLGERRSRVAVKPLCRLMAQQTDTHTLYRIIGALVAIGDTRAVAPLIEVAERKEAAFLSQVVFAVGAIGGRTAEGYLVVLASGHPDDQVQRSAKDALEDLLQRQ